MLNVDFEENIEGAATLAEENQRARLLLFRPCGSNGSNYLRCLERETFSDKFNFSLLAELNKQDYRIRIR